MALQDSVDLSLKLGMECYATKGIKKSRMCGLSENLWEVPCKYLDQTRAGRVIFQFMRGFTIKTCYGCDFPQQP